MVPPPLPHDFREFLRLLNEHKVRYLVIGGHAVGIHGYVRYTGDLDVWVPTEPVNAGDLADALRKFGFDLPTLAPELFTHEHQIVRMGHPPMRIEIHTTIPGVEFKPCYERRLVIHTEGIDIPTISLDDLKANKAATGRLKDRLDLENLPK